MFHFKVFSCCVVLLLVAISHGTYGERVKRQSPKKYKVVSIVDAPFLSLRKGNRTGNGRFVGYIPDLLREIEHINGHEYEIYLSPDGRYGGQSKDGTWNGMVGEVIYKHADFAATSLTVTHTRSKVIDFGPPFMTTGIQFLYKKPVRSTANINMFSPFSAEVWICIIGIYILSGVALYLIRRCVPTAANDDDDDEEGRSELSKCADNFWLLIKSFSLQGLKDSTVGWGGRILLGTWLMFSLMTLVFFIASLVAWFPAIVAGVHPPVPFSDPESLLDSGVKFGCVSGGSTKSFFKRSDIRTYEKMSYRMETDRSFVRTSDEGIQRTRQENYVFIGESQVLEYAATRQPCDLLVVGEQLTSNAYALATAKDSALKEDLDQAIIQLRENGALKKLREKWWYDASRCPRPDAATNAEGAEKDPDKVPLRTFLSAGPVLIYGVGLMMAVVAAGVEVVWKKRGISEQVSSSSPAASNKTTEPEAATSKADVV